MCNTGCNRNIEGYHTQQIAEAKQHSSGHLFFPMAFEVEQLGRNYWKRSYSIAYRSTTGRNIPDRHSPWTNMYVAGQARVVLSLGGNPVPPSFAAVTNSHILIHVILPTTLQLIKDLLDVTGQVEPIMEAEH
jgi:hypothetical protein